MNFKNCRFLLIGGALFGSVTFLSSCKGSNYISISSDYQIVVNLGEDIDYSYAHQINEALHNLCKYELPIVCDEHFKKNHEIVFDKTRSEYQELLPSLEEDEYLIKEKNGKIIIVSRSHMSRMCAVDHLLTKYCSKGGIKIPKGTEVKGKCKADDVVTELEMPKDKDDDPYQEIRDPFLVKDGKNYYMFGTHGWDGTDWRVYHKTDTFKGEWTEKGTNVVPNEPKDVIHQRWAPEVHKYKDNYYMFTTYNRLPGDGKQRGVTILKSESGTPEGPFKIISRNAKNDPELGHITDDSKECTIDGTLYVDPDGQPWLVYVNEWVSQLDGVGRFSAVKLSNDLTTIDESTNKELFRGDDAPWGIGDGVTDGCFIHTLSSGRLVMTWSKSNGHGYAAGFATSDHGLFGPWEQHKQLLFAEGMYKSDSLEGGHGMLFTDNGQMYMCLHGPNNNTEHPIIFPVKETNYGTISWDIYNYINKK